MKFSKFNVLVPFDKNFIFFNSFSNIFMYLEPLIAQILCKFQKNAINPEELEQIHADLFQELIKNGFIVDSKIDEFEEVKKMINEINSIKSRYRLIINPTLNCNFNCWYCYEDHSKFTKMSKETILRIQLFIDNLCSDSQLETLQLSFFGGEPLLYYKQVILPISGYANSKARDNNKGFFADITSNGFLINQKMIDQLSNLGFNCFQISFDGKREDHDNTRFISSQKGSYDIIVKNVKMIINSGLNVILRINYTKQNFEGMESILDSFDDISSERKKQITISMNKVWQEENKEIEKLVSHFTMISQKRGFNLPDPLLGNRVRNSCYADKENEAVINFDGNVYKCNARDFKDANKEGVLDKSGNIIWNELSLKRKSCRLTNKPCFDCSIFPICGGGCSQQSLEYYNRNYCVNDFDEERKKQLLLGMLRSESLKMKSNEK